MYYLQLFMLFLTIACFIFLAIGIFKPWSMLWWEDNQNRIKVIRAYGSLTIIFALAYIALKVSYTEKNELPAFEMTMASGKKVMANSLSGKSILIFFGPDCDHCQRQAEEIRKNLYLLNGYSLYFVAAHPMDQIIQFAEKFELKDQPDIYFGQVSVGKVTEVLGPMDVPTIYIYSAERVLVKKFVNETPVKEMQPFL